MSLLICFVYERPFRSGCSDVLVCLNLFINTMHRISMISERELPLVARVVFAANSRASEFQMLKSCVRS